MLAFFIDNNEKKKHYYFILAPSNTQEIFKIPTDKSLKQPLVGY